MQQNFYFRWVLFGLLSIQTINIVWSQKRDPNKTITLQLQEEAPTLVAQTEKASNLSSQIKKSLESTLRSLGSFTEKLDEQLELSDPEKKVRIEALYSDLTSNLQIPFWDPETLLSLFAPFSPSSPISTQTSPSLLDQHQEKSRNLEGNVTSAHLKDSLGSAHIIKQSVPSLIDSNIILIDVRESAEMEVSKIPGAINVEQFGKRFKNTSSLKGKTIITYCTVGYRSGLYAKDLLSLGLKVYNLRGGVLGWAHISGPFTPGLSLTPDCLTQKVHVYSPEWNLLPAGYSAVW